MQNKITIVSGANSGIGKYTAIGLAKQGATVIMICRSKERGEAALKEIKELSGSDKVELLICDLTQQALVQKTAEAIKAKYDCIDVLVNNAGGIFGTRELNEQGLERTFALNHMGYFYLTHYLLSWVKKSNYARIVNVSSTAHTMGTFDIDNLQAEKSFGQLKTYGLSKLLNIHFTRELARRLEGSHVTVNCLHPGVVKTNFGNTGTGIMKWFATTSVSFFTITPEQGAQTSLHLATSPKVAGKTGGYYAKSKPKKTNKGGRNEAHAKQLWDYSLKIANIETFGEV